MGLPKETTLELLTDLHYMPPVRLFVYALAFDTVTFEVHESFRKGTYRNSCCIAGPNKVERLSIPIESGREVQAGIAAIHIAYGNNKWQREHWNAIKTAYNRSPYFEHYAPFLQPFYESQTEKLIDFNLKLWQTLCSLLGVNLNWRLSDDFVKQVPAGVIDQRSAMHPNPSKDSILPGYMAPVYHQVFEDRHGFIPDLSILDLLFNEGPNSLAILKQAGFPTL